MYPMQIPFKTLLILPLLAMLFSCSSLPNEQSWSDDIPTVNYFLDKYTEDKAHQEALSQRDYLMWVHRFYYGWALYKRGWIQATQELNETLDTEQEKQLATDLMTQIGQLVAPEWAKNKDYRVINTRHLSIWGNTINTSVTKNQQISTLYSILADVNALLEKRINKQVITPERYFAQVPFEVGDDNNF